MPVSRHRTRARRALLAALVLAAGAGLGACDATMSVEQARERAHDTAREAALEPLPVPAGRFLLQTWRRGVGADSAELWVYLEGDGRAWRGRHRPPADPTPTRPVALELAAADPGPSVLYIARPCQFLDSPGACGPALWTGERYGEEVVAAMDQVIDAAQGAHLARRLVLVGHSGGGVVAALLAARREDVSALYTLAAPLSVAAWTRAQGLAPLAGSLDPARLSGERLHRLARVPQQHFLGEDDAVVPPEALRDYLRRLPPDSPAQLRIVAGIDHQCCWRRLWPGLVRSR